MIVAIIAILALILVVVLLILFLTLTPRVTNDSSSASKSQVMSAAATQSAISNKAVQINDSAPSATTTYSSQKITDLNNGLQTNIDGKVVNEPDYNKLTLAQQTGSAWSTSVQNTKFNELGLLTAEEIWANNKTRSELVNLLAENTNLATTLSNDPAFQALVKTDVNAYLTSYLADGTVINTAIEDYFKTNPTVPAMTITSLNVTSLSATNASVDQVLEVTEITAPVTGSTSTPVVVNGSLKVNGNIQGDTLNVDNDSTFSNVLITGVLKPEGNNAEVIATKLAAVDNCSYWTDEIDNYIVAVKPELPTSDDQPIGYGAFTTIRSVSALNNISTIFDIGAAPIVKGVRQYPIPYLTKPELGKIIASTGIPQTNLDSMLFVKSQSMYMSGDTENTFVGITRSVTVNGVMNTQDSTKSIEYNPCPVTEEQ